MNFNNFTLKAQESVQQAVNIASTAGQQAVECAHLLKGIMSEAESITEFLLGKLGISSSQLSRDLDMLIDTYPGLVRNHIYLTHFQKFPEGKQVCFRDERQVYHWEHLLMAFLIQ